jgi:hypothetical protein
MAATSKSTITLGVARLRVDHIRPPELISEGISTFCVSSNTHYRVNGPSGCRIHRRPVETDLVNAIRD